MNAPSDLGNMSCTASSKYTHYGTDPTNHPDQKELSAALENLRRVPMGYVLLASDGVLRTHTIDDEVVDAIGLPPRLIKAFIDRFPYYEEVEARFQNSDGTLIPQEQWWAPDKSLIPQRFTDEQKEKARLDYEKNKHVIEENMQKKANGEIQRCGVRIQSNYRI
ncbi:hypothetical protein N7488_000154 [Penicillium malachiteum]|nr:hypothetical protein N7488_000154 [Penicillium malachiteum]